MPRIRGLRAPPELPTDPASAMSAAGARTRCYSRLSRSSEGDPFRGSNAGQTGQNLPEAERVHIGVQSAAQILCDDQFIAMLGCAACSGLNPHVCDDATQNDCANLATTQLQVELGTVETAPVAL